MESVSKKVSELSKDGKRLYLSTLRSEFIKSPLASNVFLGLILTGLEKIVEVEFACPCDPALNAVFASMFFILPAIVASGLMLLIQGCTCQCKVNDYCERFVLLGMAPIIMWLVLVLLDGQYFACANTNWSGRFVIVDKAEPQRWCEPTNGTSYMERMRLTQTWYFKSQFAGVFIPIVCLILFGAYKGLMQCKKKKEIKERQRGDKVELQKPENEELEAFQEPQTSGSLNT